MSESSYNKRKEDKRVTKKAVEKMMKGTSFMAWMKQTSSRNTSNRENREK